MLQKNCIYNTTTAILTRVTTITIIIQTSLLSECSVYTRIGISKLQQNIRKCNHNIQCFAPTAVLPPAARPFCWVLQATASRMHVAPFQDALNYFSTNVRWCCCIIWFYCCYCFFCCCCINLFCYVACHMINAAQLLTYK